MKTNSSPFFSFVAKWSAARELCTLFCALALMPSCSQKRVEVNDDLKQEIIQVDKSMSDMATKEGFLKAILHYADDDIVKLNDGMHPIIGREKFAEVYRDKSGPTTLTWEPVKAEVARSGELGYTWGNWLFALKDTTLYGNYFTVWKKQSDGSWKVALDGGNSTPPPTSK